MKHHYESLNLEEGASQEEIQVAYDKLSKELDPAKNDNQDFFIEEYAKVQEAYKALSQSSILKNNDSSNRSVTSNRDELSSSSNSSGSFTVTISPEKIEELKNKAQDIKDEPYVKPSMFRNPFSFKGRIRRMEYGLSFIIFYISNNILTALSVEEPAVAILFIPSLWFTWAQGAKRCHDRGNSGWYQLIPFYGLWMLFGDGDIGENEYGSNPKGINKIN
tara:strand:+ start:96 stop:752 length:657 start_codon:yes stop_codon:yes gene_type:complete